MRVGGLVHNLEIADVGVTLASKEENAGVHVKEGHEGTRGLVDVGASQRLVQSPGVVESKLAIALARETHGANSLAVAKEKRLAALGARVTCPGGHAGSGPRVEQAQLLVLAGCDDERTGVVPVQALGGVCKIALEAGHLRPLFHVPNADRVVEGSGHQHIRSDGVEQTETKLLPVSVEGASGLSDVFGHTTFRDAPNLEGGILRSGHNDLIIER
mmetsp:Transcript_11143/g.25339  ORF Transcript_11143/g.25339 Transcript_11143/m.25339 type:complete len:215 (-) Transcript_11143:288-932(-)